MSPAILHITGVGLDPNVVFASLQIKPYALYTAGQTIPGRASTKYSLGGAKVSVSANNGQEQVSDAIDFLKKNKQELITLTELSSIEAMTLDFGFFHPVNQYAIFRQFPAELLLLAGSLGISIEISCYAVEDPSART